MRRRPAASTLSHRKPFTGSTTASAPLPPPTLESVQAQIEGELCRPTLRFRRHRPPRSRPCQRGGPSPEPTPQALPARQPDDWRRLSALASAVAAVGKDIVRRLGRHDDLAAKRSRKSAGAVWRRAAIVEDLGTDPDDVAPVMSSPCARDVAGHRRVDECRRRPVVDVGHHFGLDGWQQRLE